VAFLDDVRDLVAGEVSHIGLGTNATTEVSGGGYAHIAVTFVDGVLQGTPLQFNGPVGTTVTHLLFKRGGSLWVGRPVAQSQAFNSSGRLDVSASAVTAAFPT
jgi:hypothetical protein